MNLFIKRLVDVIGSFLGIVILSPILLIIAISIKTTSMGPVIFKHERLGLHGKRFWIWKFRTMVVNAEMMGDGLKVKEESDPRITSVGRFLRKTSLDELPQLFNVLGSSMSLIGPRPPATYFPYDGYENYPDWAKKRFEMRPGITGLAQATVRNSASWSERIAIDNQYVYNFNIWLDVKILWKTLMSVARSENIYRAPENTEKAQELSSEKTGAPK